ncbi:Hypothetical protein NTJ_15881 [Nesidiocoris tenuis]|uniref:Uncharacterized protein n=1 Tax=Nesidiocoris tenuis TaxID=355587 RepID=A0ABN7BFC7_9HEMI|nr:Hypothetical protein NTJ_15881 [Nesidiocoris tenuis]
MLRTYLYKPYNVARVSSTRGLREESGVPTPAAPRSASGSGGSSHPRPPLLGPPGFFTPALGPIVWTSSSLTPVPGQQLSLPLVRQIGAPFAGALSCTPTVGRK